MELMGISEYIVLYPPAGSVECGVKQWQHDVMTHFVSITGALPSPTQLASRRAVLVARRRQVVTPSAVRRAFPMQRTRHACACCRPQR